LSAPISLASIVNAPAWMKTLPPVPRTPGLPTSSLEPPLRSTDPKLPTVNAGVLRGSTGISPAPAALVTWIVPPGAVRFAAEFIETGPATNPSVPGTGPGLLPLTEIAAGFGVGNPKAAGGTALNLLASGLVA
jgi:hypothetical protein